MEALEAGDLFPDAGVEGVGTRHVTNGDLQGDLHCSLAKGMENDAATPAAAVVSIVGPTPS